jgi:putative membrane protein
MRVVALAAAVSLTALAACSSHTSDQTADSNVMMANDSLMANNMAVEDAADDSTNIAAAAAMPNDAATFMSTAAASDLFETQSSKLALEKSTNTDVRDFAKMMITDHAKTTQGVKDAAKKANLTVPTPTLNADQQQMMAALHAASGDAFDQTYLQQQLAGHQQALALMQNYAESGDTPALQNAAKTAIPIVQKHLARLKELTKQGE